MNSLKYIEIDHFELCSGRSISLKLSYQHFGRPLHEAPIVLVNHALTGNSQVTGTNGWWNAIVGEEKIIDTSQYTILSFNIPGNGFGNTKEHFVEYYKEFTAKDIARLFAIGLQSLQVSKLFAVIGGSVGGGIVAMAAAVAVQEEEGTITIATMGMTTTADLICRAKANHRQ